MIHQNPICLLVIRPTWNPQTTRKKWLFQYGKYDPLRRKWLGLGKHQFLSGCFGFQVQAYNPLSRIQNPSVEGFGWFVS